MSAALRRRVAVLEGRRGPSDAAAEYLEILAELEDERTGHRPPSPPLPARNPIARALAAWRPDTSLDAVPPTPKRSRRTKRKGER